MRWKIFLNERFTKKKKEMSSSTNFELNTFLYLPMVLIINCIALQIKILQIKNLSFTYEIILIYKKI